MGRGRSKAGAKNSTATVTRAKSLEKMTKGEVMGMTDDEFKAITKGKSYYIKRNDDGTLKYAEYLKEETLTPSEFDAYDHEGQAEKQFIEWAKQKEPNIKYSSVEIGSERYGNKNTVTAWKPNGDKDFFDITKATVDVENKVETYIYSWQTKNDKVSVRKNKRKYAPIYSFEYTGTKKY